LDTLLQPDLFAVPIEQARTLDWSRMTTLPLVAAVRSRPSTPCSNDRPATGRSGRRGFRSSGPRISVPGAP